LRLQHNGSFKQQSVVKTTFKPATVSSQWRSKRSLSYASATPLTALPHWELRFC